MGQRFRGFMPVIMDVETGGFDAERDALLEIAVVIPGMDAAGFLHPQPVVSSHVEPFPGANIDPRSLEITGIDPDNPLRGALSERMALDHIFAPVREAMRHTGCQRAILVGHNAAFDLAFLNAAVRRCGHKRNPFHPFSCFDTATLAGLAYGQTVLSKAALAAGLDFDSARGAFGGVRRRAHRRVVLHHRQPLAPAGDVRARADRTGRALGAWAAESLGCDDALIHRLRLLACIA